MATTPRDLSPSPEQGAPPSSVVPSSVLVVLVSRDGISWLRESLAALAAQTYPRLGVVAVDQGSTDGSRELLEGVLGSERVLSGPPDGDVAGALRALRTYPPAQAVDYLLLIHDDALLEPDAIGRLVEAAEGIAEAGRIGIVGPKVVDWDDPRILREVGRSVDGLGHPYSALQEGELDQGQYDRIVEVLYVSACTMLVSTDVWRRVGDFDGRYEGYHDDMDFCWRARIAGFRVVMNPLAVARHRGASMRGERNERARIRGRRYFAERAALGSMLKNYALRSLAVYLPLYLVFSAVRLSILAVARRFEEALEILAAIGWNATHLVGTIRLRRRAQALRVARDGAIRRFMTSPFRIPNWFERAEELIEDSLTEDEEEAARRPPPPAPPAAVAEHPVLAASLAAVVIGWLATRHLRADGALVGGALAAFPASPGDFFAEFVAPVRTTLLGGGQGASPALAWLGAFSFLSFGNPAFAQRLLLTLLIPAIAVLTYRTWRGRVHGPGSGVIAAASYVASGVVLWAFSEGRIPMLVVAAALPLIWSRIQGAFDRRVPPRDARTIGELAVVIAVAVAFVPGAWLAVLLLCGVEAAARRTHLPLRSIGLSAAGALALTLTTIPSLVTAPGAELSSYVGSARMSDILRLTPGPGPGTGITAWFLPLLALLCYAVMPESQRPRADRAMIVVGASIALAWLGANGYLPAALTNPPVFVTLAAFSCAWIVGLGSSALATRFAQTGRGLRRVGSVLVVVLLVGGLGGQSLAAVIGGWGVGADRLPPGWPIVSSADGDFRVLWISGLDGRGLPAPGGDAHVRLAAGAATITYALTGRDGASALDTGRGASGSGYRYLHRVLEQVFGGATVHAGTLLAPLGIRYVVARGDDLPRAAFARLRRQVDLDLLPAGELDLFLNGRALPIAAILEGDDAALPLEIEDLPGIESLPPITYREMERRDDTWQLKATAERSVVYLSQQFDGGWSVGGGPGAERAFGWATAFQVGTGRVIVRHEGGPVRWILLGGLVAAWVAALWVTRRQAST